MKERYKRKRVSTVLGILITLMLLALILLLHGILTAINTVLEISFMEFIEYGIILLIGILIVRKWLTEYEYTVTDDGFYVDRILGSRSRLIFGTSLSEIVYISKEKPKDFKGKTKRLTFRSGKKDKAYMVAVNDCQKICVVFSPSDKMTELLESRTLGESC